VRRWCARLTAAAGAIGLAAGLAVGSGAAVATGQPSPTPGAELPEPVPGEPVCQLTDPRLLEVSGLVAFDDGYAVVNDGTLFGDRVGVFFLDQSCQVVRQVGYPSPPRDPEELAWDRENDVLWVGDTGDNFETTGQQPRPSVAFWRIDLASDQPPVIHRFTYPDRPRDAEALLLDADGTPIIVSKDVSGTAELFVPEELRPSTGPDDTVPLAPAGEVTLPETETDHRLGPAARQVVTGAANSPDGSRVVLRSYTDAFEYDVTDGDVVAELTTGAPRITPLPDEPLGEAIAYSPDGARFLTVSEVPEGEQTPPTMLAYTPTAPAPEPPTEPPPAESASGGGGGFFTDLQDIINVIAAAGVIGVLLVAAGVFGIIRARRAAGPGDPAGANADAPPAPATGRARLPGAAGGAGAAAGGAGAAAAAAPVAAAEQPPAGPAPGVYTSSAARQSGTEYRGTEYGGGRDYQDPGYGDPGYGDPGYGDPGYGGTEYGGGREHDDPGYHNEYQGTGYRGGEYPGGEYGSDAPHRGEYGGDAPHRGEYGGGAPHRGEYGGGAEHGGRAYGGAGHRRADHPGDGGSGHRYGPTGYPEGGYPEPYDQDWSGGYPDRAAGRGHASGAHHPAGPDYSDDPDYPYEFRPR